MLAGCACEDFFVNISLACLKFYVYCSLLLGGVSVWTVKTLCDSSLKDTLSTMTITIINSVRIILRFIP